MTNIFAVTQETYLRLRRDRIFMPAAMVGAGLILLSGLASYWSVEDFYKILFDLGTTVFHLVGVIVAIFWSIKLIHDTKQEGSVEVQLAAPIRRSEWILGKFLGLSLALTLLATTFLLSWQIIFWGYGLGWIGVRSVTVFGILGLSWLVMAASSILMATMASHAVALFAAIWLFISGLISAPILQSLSPDTPAWLQGVIAWAAGLWDLQFFNLHEIGSGRLEVSWSLVQPRLIYGAALLGTLLSLSCVVFNRRDLQS
jgi:ABC-type transport system involved in multi-copper enzyme maturation permease subunit